MMKSDKTFSIGATGAASPLIKDGIKTSDTESAIHDAKRSHGASRCTECRATEIEQQQETQPVGWLYRLSRVEGVS